MAETEIPDWAQETDAPDWATEPDNSVPPIDLSRIRAEPSNQPSMFSSGYGPSVPPIDNPDWAYTKSVVENPIGAAQELLRIPGKIRESLASKALNLPQAVTREVGIGDKTENVISPEGIGQREKPLYFQPGQSVISGEPNAVKNLATPGLATLLTPAAPIAGLSYLTDMAASIPDFWKEATDPGKTFEEKGRFITENLAPLAIPVLGHKLAPEMISKFRRSVLENPPKSAIPPIDSIRTPPPAVETAPIKPTAKPVNVPQNVDTKGVAPEALKKALNLENGVASHEEALYPSDQLNIRDGEKTKSGQVTSATKIGADTGKNVYQILYTHNGEQLVGYSENPIWEQHANYKGDSKWQPPHNRSTSKIVSPEVTPGVKELADNIISGKRVTNKDSMAVGASLKSVADLNELASQPDKIRAASAEVKNQLAQETDPEKQMELLGKNAGLNPQYPKEAIEFATNTGAWVEGEIGNSHGPRPLDWKTNPEVADWLRQNGKRIGIDLPEELKSGSTTKPSKISSKLVAEPATAPEPAKGTVPMYRGQEGAGAGGSFWSKDPQYARTFGANMQRVDVPQAVADAARKAYLETGNATKDAHILPDEWVKKAQAMENPPEQVVHDLGGDTQDVNNLPTVSSVALDPATGNTISATDTTVNKAGIGEPAMAGPGGTIPSNVGTKPELAQLTDAVRTMAAGQAKPQLARAYSIGEKLSQFKDAANRAVDGLRAVGAYAKMRLEGMPKWDGLKAAVGRRQLDLAESSATAREFSDKALRAVPDAIDREAISNFVDAGGDAAVLQKGLAETKDIYKKGYERALKLTPEQKVLAENVKNYFDSRLNGGIEAGVLESGIEDYIHRTYEKDSPWKQGVIAELRSGVFTGKPALAKQRVFQYDFEAEKAGYKPVKDFVRRISEYDQSLNKSIADRRMVKEMMSENKPDGRPAIDVAGVGTPVDGKGDTDPLLVKSQTKTKGETPKDNRADYIAYDHPALRKWKWINTDDAGKTTMLQGQVLIHPDALKQIKAVFGRSAIRENIVGRGALAASSTVKQTMLDLSGFHPVQITVHGWEHRTFKPVEKIDFENPTQRALISHGVVAGDAHGYEAFSEGLSGSSLSKHIPGIGPKLQAYNQWLFQDYIPRLKMGMAIHALDRNRSRFSKDIASGKMTEDQVLHLTANQANAAFGELNYEMMGRNKTVQDALRLGLLAPDFLEARGKFAAQAATKYGTEQRAALLLGAATLYLTARIVNKQLDDQYHFEPANAFNVVYKGKAYSLRTVQGDILHAAMEPSQFIRNRLNPTTTRPIMEFATGRDYFGRKRTGLEQIKDMGSQLIPISFRGALNPREQNLTESFMNAFGITEHRSTATDTIGQLATKFKQKNGVKEPGEFIYDPDKDPYRGVKLALLYEDPRKAAQEIKHAVDNGDSTAAKISQHFNNYSKKPLTGSAKLEQAFVSSLTADQKKTYDESVKERQKMRENAYKAMTIYQNEFSGQKAAEPQIPDWAK